MGWLWGSGDPENDAYQGLTPEIRQALRDESPSAQAQTQAQSHPSARALSQTQPRVRSASQPGEASDYYRTKAGLINPPRGNDASSQDNVKPAVPAESLFQDGRYAHLWASYERPEQIESAAATATASMDQLESVADMIRERQACISRAALENCVFYQLAERDCLDNGSLKDRLTMCGSQSKASNRCYTMQIRFLRALGYASTDATPADDDKIQMHSEVLYNEMLDRERKIEQAKRAGLPEPKFAPLMESQASSNSNLPAQPVKSARSEALALLGKDRLRELDLKMDGKSQLEKELELQLVVADAKINAGYGARVNRYFEQEKTERDARRAKGQETFGDTLKRLWGYNS